VSFLDSHQLLDLSTAGGSAFAALGVLGLIRLCFRRDKGLEDA
jgi:hypothetical protein